MTNEKIYIEVISWILFRYLLKYQEIFTHINVEKLFYLGLKPIQNRAL